MLRCDYVNGVLTLYNYPSVTCWQYFHILHACCAIIAIIVFLSITLIIVLILFEVNPVSNEAAARVNSRNEFWQNIFKFLSILLSTFFFQEQYRWPQTIFLTGGSILLFIKRRNEKPYYQESINTLMDVINALFMWSCFCLIVVMISETTQFDGGLQIFFMSIPLISIMIITKRDKRNGLLLKQISSFDNPDDWLLKIRFYIMLVQHKDLNREAAVQLNGFLFHHEETCTLGTCPLKAYAANALAILKDKKKKSIPKAGAENFALLMSFANQLFTQGVSKFSTSSSLHISFAIFLKYRMNNKSVAINELAAAEKCSPQFDDQFNIFRYRKILEDEMTELQEGGGSNFDVVSMLTYENYFQQCKTAIERTAYLHMEFWMELLDSELDLGKLDTTGMKINESIIVVKERWAKLQKLNPNSSKALKYYADFLTEILNDSEGGGELLLRAKNNDGGKVKFASNSVANAESIGMGDICATMGGADGTPCVVVSGEQSNFGEIMQFNMSVCRLFGFTKTELLGRKIGVLMPDLFAKEHDTFLHNGINSAEEQGANSTKTEKFVLGKHKSGYLLPCPLQARVVISVTQGAFFVGTFKTDKKGLNATYLLLDDHQDVIGVSSRACSSIGLTNSLLRNYRVSAQILAPGILDKNNLTQYMSKTGGTLDFFFPDTSNDSDLGCTIFNKTIMLGSDSAIPLTETTEKLRIRASKKFVKMNCILSELTFSSQPRGHIVRLEPLEGSKSEANQIKLEREAKYPNCQFVFDPIEMKYLQQTCDEDAQRLIAEETGNFVNILRDRSGSNLSPNRSDDSRERLNTSMISGSREPTLFEEIKKMQKKLEGKRKEYSEGVETYRLVNGVKEKMQATKIRLLEIQLEEQNELDDNAKKEQNNKKDDFFLMLKSKKAFNEALTEKSTPPSVKKLTYAGYLFVLLLLTLASVEFGLTTTQFNDIESNISIVKDSYLQIVAQMRIIYYINKIVLLMKKDNPKFKSNGTNEDIISSKKIIDESLKQYFEQANSISLSTISRLAAHDWLFQSKSVALYYTNVSGSVVTNNFYTLPEAIQQMASEIFTVNSFTDYSKYTLANDDVFFCLYNGFSELYKRMVASANYYVDELSDRGTKKVEVILIIFIVALSVLVASICVMFPIVIGVSSTRLKILTLFFDIPQTTVRSLLKKCEKFVAENKEENVELISGSESNSPINGNREKNEEDGSISQGKSKRRHRYKNNTTSNGAFYIYFTIAAIIIAGYFSTNFAFGYVFLKNVHGYSRELRALSVLHSETTYSLSIFQGLLGNGRIMTLNTNQTFELLASQQITELYSDAQEIQISHNENSGQFVEDYQDNFINIMRKNICTYSSQFGFSFDCGNFLEGTTQEGLHPVIVNFIETLRQMLTTYWQILASSASNDAKNSTISSTLLNSNDFSGMEISIVDIVDPALTFLEDQLSQSYDTKLNSELTLRIILFIFFLLGFFIAYLSFWGPFTSRLNAEVF